MGDACDADLDNVWDESFQYVDEAGDVQQDDFSGAMKFKVNKVYTMEEARRRFLGAVVIDFLDQPSPADLPARLKRCLEPHRLRDIGCRSYPEKYRNIDSPISRRGFA